MQSVCLELSKYVLAFLMAFYALAAYRGAVIRNEEKRGTIYITQNIIMVVVHFIGFLIMYIVYDDMKYIFMYFAQLVYFMVVIMIYMIFYPKASRLLVNNMCMLMAVGFVMIARLDYAKCVKQFAIAVAGTILHGFEFVFVRLAPLVFIASVIGMDILRSRTCTSYGGSFRK